MGLISDVGQMNWALYQIEDNLVLSLVMRIGKSQGPYAGDRKVSWALYRAQDGYQENFVSFDDHHWPYQV